MYYGTPFIKWNLIVYQWLQNKIGDGQALYCHIESSTPNISFAADHVEINLLNIGFYD